MVDAAEPDLRSLVGTAVWSVDAPGAAPADAASPIRKTVILFRSLIRLLIAWLIVVCAALVIDGDVSGLPDDGADAVMAMELDAEPELQAPAGGNDSETHAASPLAGSAPALNARTWRTTTADPAVGWSSDPWRPPPRG